MYKSTKLQTSHVQEYKTANLSCTRVQTTSYKLLNYESTKLQISYFKKLQSSKPLMYKSTKLSNKQAILNKTIKQPKKILQTIKQPNQNYTKLSNNPQPIFYKTIKQTNPYFTKLSNKPTHILQNY